MTIVRYLSGHVDMMMRSHSMISGAMKQNIYDVRMACRSTAVLDRFAGTRFDLNWCNKTPLVHMWPNVMRPNALCCSEQSSSRRDFHSATAPTSRPKHTYTHMETRIFAYSESFPLVAMCNECTRIPRRRTHRVVVVQIDKGVERDFRVRLDRCQT